MNKFSPLIIISLALFMVSCSGNKKEIQYKRHLSENKAYEVEVPSDYVMKTSMDSWMDFVQDKTNSLLFIKALKPDESLYGFAEDYHKNSADKFDYTIYEETDTSVFYRVTKGVSMFSSYCLYMSKRLDDTDYVIYLTSPTKSKEVLEETIRHIQRSLVAHSNETEIDESKSKKGKTDKFSLRNTNFYSIEYPKEWKVMTNINEMTDAYIGSENEMLGLTIIFFDTDYSLDEIKQESHSGLQEMGGKIVSCNKTSINGQPCYMTVCENEMSGRELITIDYIFKKGETMYSVKFGSDRKEMNNNSELIERIINTFHIK